MRPDYCPIGNQPCQSLCDEPCSKRPKRKPLTDEEIYDMYNEPRSDAEMIAFARAIEAAHGIKGEA